MSFDRFAREAGRAAVEEARRATRPEINVARISRRRRTAVSVGLFSFFATLALVGSGLMLWRGAPPFSPSTATEPPVSSISAVQQQLDAELPVIVPTTVAPSEVAVYVADGADGGCGIGNMPEGWQDDAISLGPLWLWHVASPGRGGDADRSVKTIAILEPGAAVTLAVPDTYRDRVSHLFDASMWNQTGRYRVADGGRTVTFLPCDSEPAQFVGGFIFRGDSCVEFDIAIGDADPVTVAVSLSSTSCM